MIATNSTESSEIALLRDGGEDALAELFSCYRSRLERIVDFRLDARLQGRVDTSDVLQEACIEAARRLNEYLASPNVSLFVWFRQITWQTLLGIHRRHLGQKRNAGQEVSLHRHDSGGTTSLALAQQLDGGLTSPSQVAIREERWTQLREALDGMDEIDREIIALRHFEQLGNGEVAEILNIKQTTASNRYVRALKRLREILAATPSLHDDQV